MDLFVMILSMTVAFSVVSLFEILLQLKIKSKKFRATKEESVKVIIIMIAIRFCQVSYLTIRYNKFNFFYEKWKPSHQKLNALLNFNML